jgi:hypothetical protein
MPTKQLKRAFTVVAPLLLGVAFAGCWDHPALPRPSATDVASYTASEALNAYITGPTELAWGDHGTWYANPSGGDGTYSYLWQYKKAGSTLWTNVGTGSSYMRGAGSTFDLKLTVSSAGQSVVRGIQVVVSNSCGSTC